MKYNTLSVLELFAREFPGCIVVVTEPMKGPDEEYARRRTVTIKPINGAKEIPYCPASNACYLFSFWEMIGFPVEVRRVEYTRDSDGVTITINVRERQ